MSQAPGPSIPMRGAVDLAAGAAAAKRRQQPPPPASAAGSFVVDVDEAGFQSVVIEQSMTVPVVIDLWAEWCGPCKQLSPVLERLADEYGGRFLLAKVDVDANPRLGQVFQAQSIPMVVAVVKGQPVPLFQGAVPEQQVRAYLDELLKVSAANGVTGVLAGAGEQPAADEDAEPPLPPLHLLLRTEGVDPAQARAAAAAAPTDPAAQILVADLDLLGGHVEDAFARLVDTVRATSGEDRNAVRAHLVELFTVVGPQDERVATARRALTAALF
jgi:putative thioredoxin